MTTPTADFGAPSPVTTSSIAFDSTFARPTTAIRPTTSSPSADQRVAVARRRGVLLVVGHEVVAVADGLDEHEQA